MVTAGLAAALAPVTFASAAAPAPGTLAAQPVARPMAPASAGPLTQGRFKYLSPRGLSTKAPQVNSRTATAAGTNNNLVYGGGRVATSPAVYIVFWGSQWSRTDPYATYLQNFLKGLDAGDGWTNVVHQYCEGVPPGTIHCGTAGSHINAVGSGALVKGIWWDNALPAVPYTSGVLNVPTADAMASEAVTAAQHFGNTTAASNVNTQYVIALPPKTPSPGFGYYCAYHSSVSSNYGEIAYTNLPYQNDLGTLCGQGTVNMPGTYDGVSIVEGIEFIDTITDMEPPLGWVDATGQEAAEKCAWVGPKGDITTPTGTFPVWSIWSNEANGGAGACVMS
jgi:serine protease